MTEKTSSSVARTVEAFKNSPSLHPLVVGHMCKQDKSHFTFSKRYFALYEGGLLVYYSHERAFKEDVKKHQGVPLHCTLVKLDGMYLTRREGSHQHGVKHCFTLHAPEKSNHRKEFLLACQRNKDMRIWVEQLQSQNTELAVGDEHHHHKAPPYIQKIRLQSSMSIDNTLRRPLSFTELDLKQNSYNPGDIALLFGAQSLATEPQFLAI